MTDRNSIIGISLMVVLIIIYYTVVVPRITPEQLPPPKQEQVAQEENPTADSQLTEAETPEPLTKVEKDSLKESKLSNQYGDFGHLMVGDENMLTVRTEKLTVSFSSLGGHILSATLNDYQTFDSLPLPIVANLPENEFYFEFVAKGESSQPIRSDQLYFKPSEDRDVELSGNDSTTVSFIAKLDDQRYIEQVYTFKGNTSNVGYKINLVGLKQVMKNTYYELNWISRIPQTEKDIKSQRQKTQLVYQQGDDLERLGGMSDDTEEEFVKNGIDWISYKSQFFSQAIIPKKSIASAKLEINTPAGDYIAKEMRANMEITAGGNDVSNEFTFYLGPNEYYSLTSYGVGLEDQMDLGYLFISWINKATIWLFKQMEKVISNYGIIILLFAIIIKMIVFPMTYKSYLSMAKLRVINGTDEMKALDTKYKEDAQKLQIEKMAVYKKMGVSPLGGCLPMILQYPILIAMFFFFPQSVELRGKPFLWATDLSTYDSIYDLPFNIPGYGDHISLFTLLMAVSIYIYTYFQQKSQPTNTAMPFMKYLPYMMPVIFVVFLNNYASGLSWYYFAANIISIIQTTAIRASLNDEKLLAQMHENSKTKKKKKGTKGKNKGTKSKLETWAEKQQKKQQEVQRLRQDKGENSRRSRRKK